MCLEIVHARSNGSRKKTVVRIDPGEDLAARLEKSLGCGVGRPLIGLRNIAEAILVALQHLECAVGGSAIHHDVFDIRIILRQHALDGLPQIVRHVVRRRNDADERHAHVPNLTQLSEAGPRPASLVTRCFLGNTRPTESVSASPFSAIVPAGAGIGLQGRQSVLRRRLSRAAGSGPQG